MSGANPLEAELDGNITSLGKAPSVQDSLSYDSGAYDELSSRVPGRYS